MYGAGAGLIAHALGGGSTTVTELHGDRNPGFGGMHPEPIDRYMPEAMALMAEGHHDVLSPTTATPTASASSTRPGVT